MIADKRACNVSFIVSRIIRDPLSNVYLLVTFVGGRMILVDGEAGEMRMEFEHQPHGACAERAGEHARDCARVRTCM